MFKYYKQIMYFECILIETKVYFECMSRIVFLFFLNSIVLLTLATPHKQNRASKRKSNNKGAVYMQQPHQTKTKAKSRTKPLTAKPTKTTYQPAIILTRNSSPHLLRTQHTTTTTSSLNNPSGSNTTHRTNKLQSSIYLNSNANTTP